MGKVVHGVCVPLGTCAVVWNLDDAIDDRIAEVHVGVGHIQFGTQHHAALNSLGSVHLLKQAQVLLNRTIAERTGSTRLCGGTLLLGNLL